MKRPALGEPEGALQLSEKAAKEGDAEAELARADPLLELLCTFTAEDKARRWKNVLYDRDVVSLDDLVGLAQDKGWQGFLNKLRNADQDVLASKLNAWRQGLGHRELSGGDSPGKQSTSAPFFSSFLVSSFALLRHSLVCPPRHCWCKA